MEDRSNSCKSSVVKWKVLQGKLLCRMKDSRSGLIFFQEEIYILDGTDPNKIDIPVKVKRLYVQAPKRY
jgi:hypothetical protein